MKTTMPEAIKTQAEAKQFLQQLHDNDESFHPEDDATTIIWNGEHAHKGKYLFTRKEGETLNKLMNDIYSLEGNSNVQDMAFDPCAMLLHCDPDYKARVAFDVFQDFKSSGPVHDYLIMLCEKQSEKEMGCYLKSLAVSIKFQNERSDIQDVWRQILGELGYELIQHIIKYEL